MYSGLYRQMNPTNTLSISLLAHARYVRKQHQDSGQHNALSNQPRNIRAPVSELLAVPDRVRANDSAHTVLHEQRSTHDSLLCVAGDVGGHDCVRHAETVALEIAALDDIRDLFPVRPKLHNQTKGKKMRILDETICARVVDRDTAGSMCGTD
jgi:hypothetical protein